MIYKISKEGIETKNVQKLRVENLWLGEVLGTTVDTGVNLYELFNSNTRAIYGENFTKITMGQELRKYDESGNDGLDDFLLPNIFDRELYKLRVRSERGKELQTIDSILTNYTLIYEHASIHPIDSLERGGILNYIVNLPEKERVSLDVKSDMRDKVNGGLIPRLLLGEELSPLVRLGVKAYAKGYQVIIIEDKIYVL